MEPSLAELLDQVSRCNACGLMAENKALGIPFVPIEPRPRARVLFFGRDPNPRTAEAVGERSGRSAFAREIYRLAGEAGLAEDLVYVTHLLKCHWRTMAGRPLPRTEGRLTRVNLAWAETCLRRWLVREIEVLRPRLLVAFGEDLYGLLRPWIAEPDPPPERLTVSADKSVVDAELWFAQNGPLALELAGGRWPLAVLRYSGHEGRIQPRDAGDRRWAVYQRSQQRVVELLRGGKMPDRGNGPAQTRAV